MMADALQVMLGIMTPTPLDLPVNHLYVNYRVNGTLLKLSVSEIESWDIVITM